MNNYHLIDTASNTTRYINCLRESEISTVIRYYSANRYKWKRMTEYEAQVLSENGFQIAAVYQNVQTRPEDFSAKKGKAAATDALNYAQTVINQPEGSAIYFAVDFNATEADIQNAIIPYFKGVRSVIGEEYKIGIYGSGLVINQVHQAGLAVYRWLSASTSFRGTRQAIQNGEYDMRQFPMSKLTLCDFSVDFNVKLNPATDIGTFSIASE